MLKESNAACMESAAGYLWPSFIGRETLQDFLDQSSAESIAATVDGRYVAVGFTHTDTTIVGSGPSPKAVALLDTTLEQWLFV